MTSGLSSKPSVLFVWQRVFRTPPCLPRVVRRPLREQRVGHDGSRTRRGHGTRRAARERPNGAASAVAAIAMDRIPLLDECNAFRLEQFYSSERP